MSAHSLPPLLSVSMIWRGKWIILGCVTATMLAACVYLFAATPIYESEARLMVRQKGLQFETEKGFLKDRQFLATEAEVLRSEPNVRRALQSVHPVLPDTFDDDPMSYVLDSLTVTPSPVADVLTIRYRSVDQQDSIEMLRAMIDSYQEMVLQNEGDNYGSTIGVIAAREQQLREELARLQSEYEEIRRNSPLIGQGGETLNLQAKQLAALSERLGVAKGRRFDVEKKLESFAGFQNRSSKEPAATQFVLLRGLETGLPDAATVEASPMDDVVALSYTGFGDAALHNSAAAQMFRQQAESKLAQMHDVQRQFWLAEAAAIRTAVKPSHPGHNKVAEELEHWKKLVDHHEEHWAKFLDEQVHALTSVLEQELKTAIQTEHELEALYQETEQQVKQLDAHLLREQTVLRKIEQLETVHETMLARLVDFEMADQANQKGRMSVDVRVLAGPELSGERVWPLPPLVMAGAMLLGCLMALTLLILSSSTQPMDRFAQV